MRWICLILIVLFSCTYKAVRTATYYDDLNHKIIKYYNENDTLIKEEFFNDKNKILIINEYDYNIKKIKIFYENGKIQTEKVYRLVRVKVEDNENIDRFLREAKNKSLPLPSLMKDMNIKTKDFSDIVDIENIQEIIITDMNNWNDFDSDYGFLIKDGQWNYYNLDGSIKETLFYNLGFLEQKITYEKNNIIKIYNYDSKGNLID